MKIGLVLLIEDDKGSPRRYSSVRELALQGEAAGFDSLWLYDHLLHYGKDESTIGIWECWTILSALAESTRHVELGTLVLCNQFRNPALLAKMAITFDEVCNGRLTLGLGAGWNEREFKAFGYPFDHRVDRFEEALQIIKPLLREGHVDFRGKYFQAPNCEIKPRGPRLSGPPLLIAGSGPRMLRLTATYADSWNAGHLGEPATLIEPRRQLENACAEVGRDPASLEVTVSLPIGYPDLGDPPKAFKYCLIGSPEEIAAIFKGYESLGVGHLMLHVEPQTPEVLNRIAEALHYYRTVLARAYS
jgi:alkanesulfonate monooxygenase SsuD/methylene tetrahydromethanopterin reductase-like flavin-dependent oxidoreductase (luciferase family)